MGFDGVGRGHFRSVRLRRPTRGQSSLDFGMRHSSRVRPIGSSDRSGRVVSRVAFDTSPVRIKSGETLTGRSAKLADFATRGPRPRSGFAAGRPDAQTGATDGSHPTPPRSPRDDGCGLTDGRCPGARMAKLVDAPGLGPDASNGVRVRVPLLAPSSQGLKSHS